MSPSYSALMTMYIRTMLKFEKIMDDHENGDDITESMGELWSYMYDTLREYGGVSAYDRMAEEI